MVVERTSRRQNIFNDPQGANFAFGGFVFLKRNRALNENVMKQLFRNFLIAEVFLCVTFLVFGHQAYGMLLPSSLKNTGKNSSTQAQSSVVSGQIIVAFTDALTVPADVLLSQHESFASA